ncbi:methyltransferase domain-containing protein [Streptomyces sp. NPDC057257]|uniref:methyltransferase domain-containing protein n=1 Tax=Streptomyces sp. NPDC057257 TaxID=3346071 RepID=UPI003643223F
MNAMNSVNRLRTRVRDLDRQRRHRSTARAVLRVLPEPESWLDIGTGEAHFPETAREFFPYTSFDGVDATTRVTWAREADRVEEAYVGTLTDPPLARALRARYDVVTLLRPPATPQELHAAVAALRPTGILVLEFPQSHAAGLRTELDAQPCTVLTTTRLVLDRFATNTHRVVARRDPSPS